MTIGMARVGESRAVLEASGLVVHGARTAMALNVELSLRAGQLGMIHCPDPALSGRIGDSLLGLDAQPSAAVSYLAQRWSDLAPAAALNLRRRVGRVQSRGNWMETRSVMDNVLLPARHNTIVAESELRESAGNMAQRFGLPGLSLNLPEACSPTDLEAAACIRAFLGRPQLVLLEHPLRRIDSPLFVPLVQAVQQFRRRGGAALWFTAHRVLFSDPGIPADFRLRVVGERLLAVDPATLDTDASEA